METNMETAFGVDSLLVRRSKKKKYIPEKFAYFWHCDSSISQNFQLPDDLEDVLDGEEARLDEAQVPGEVAQGAAAVPKVVKAKTVKKPKSRLKSVTNNAPVKESMQSEQGGIDKLAEIDKDTKVPDLDTMYEAQCILKQRQRKGGRRQFLVKWAGQSSTDSWCDENDASDALLAHWFITHNQKGLKQKRLNLALIKLMCPVHGHAGGGGRKKSKKGVREWTNSGTNYEMIGYIL